MPANSTDEMFPALNWQMFIAERLIQRFNHHLFFLRYCLFSHPTHFPCIRYLHFPEWFEDRLGCARYSHIPLGNLGYDVTNSITDMFFARQLQHNRHLLWASEGSLPDIGGAELDQSSIWR